MEPRGYRMVVSTDLEYVQACGVACGHLGAGPGGPGPTVGGSPEKQVPDSVAPQLPVQSRRPDHRDGAGARPRRQAPEGQEVIFRPVVGALPS